MSPQYWSEFPPRPNDSRPPSDKESDASPVMSAETNRSNPSDPARENAEGDAYSAYREATLRLHKLEVQHVEAKKQWHEALAELNKVIIW